SHMTLLCSLLYNILRHSLALPPLWPLFPYTTLFRHRREGRAHTRDRGGDLAAHAAVHGGGGVSLVWIPVLCLLTTMFFSAAEMAFIAANRLRLRHLAEEGSRTAARYLEAFRHPERILSTAMVGVTISHIVASSIATVVLIPAYGGWAWLVATAVITPVMLVFGEIIPKAVAREWATSLILRLYRPLTWPSEPLLPVLFIPSALVAAMLRLVGGPVPDTRH